LSGTGFKQVTQNGFGLTGIELLRAGKSMRIVTKLVLEFAGAAYFAANNIGDR